MDPTAAAAKMKKIEPPGFRLNRVAAMAPTPEITVAESITAHTLALVLLSTAPTSTLIVSIAPAIDWRRTRERGDSFLA